MKKIDGHNILPLLETKADAKSPHKAYFLRIGNWKLLSGAGRQREWTAFVRPSKDIGEKDNVAADNPKVVKLLVGALEAFKSEMKADAATIDIHSSGTASLRSHA